MDVGNEKTWNVYVGFMKVKLQSITSLFFHVLQNYFVEIKGVVAQIHGSNVIKPLTCSGLLNYENVFVERTFPSV